MRKITIFLIISCFTIHCKPSPKKSEKKDHHLHLENLIYEVSLSSLRMAYQMDVKRTKIILNRTDRQRKKDWESFSVALKAQEDQIQVLEDRVQVLEGNLTTTEISQLQVQAEDEAGSAADGETQARSLEEELTQLETLVLGGEDLEGILFRVKVLQGHLLVPSDSSEQTGEETEISATQPVTELETTSSVKLADTETRVENLKRLIHGSEDSPGILFQITDLENGDSSVELTAEQTQALTENVIEIVEEWKSQIPEEASVEDRLKHLETLIYGAEDWEGIVSEIAYLQKQFGILPSDSLAP